ncbi:serine/threonine protein kinase [Thermoleophilia bacterium SCSIO 60948]|nr:serine/threonine protein kinase [Thermoleophilia bacterium SCSIO 60948]
MASSQTLPARLEADELILERFRILDQLGSGGMGTVHRAFDERLQRYVAVKQVHGDDPGRVLREAQASARLNHPGIVTLYELGEHEGGAILVSELVEGGTLAELARAGGLADRDIAELGAGLCEALAHAHARGVVHRDLKPSNVLVCRDEALGRRAKLLDFGIARLVDGEDLTETGAVHGTLAYMSPEQADGEEAGPESDVYSLALTLYECWAAHNPVAGANAADTARRIGEPVAPLAETRPDLPPELTTLLARCLDADPGRRPGPDELAAEFDLLAARLPDDRPVPMPRSAISAGTLRGERSAPSGGAAFALALLTVAAALATGLGLGLPGVAAALTVLAAPVVVLAVAYPAVAVAPLGVLLGPLGAAVAFAAPAAALGRGLAERALLAATGAIWALAGSWALGAAGFGPPPAGWTADAGLALESLASALLTPEAAALALLAGLAAPLLGVVLRARHLALALLGAIVWTACLDAVLGELEVLSQNAQPLVLVAVAGLATAGSIVIRSRRGGPDRTRWWSRRGHGWSGRLA